jgi:hypothetical protein
MADHWIILIPRDPHYMPEANRRARALARFQQLAPVADDLVVHARDNIGFFDCGGNFQGIACPSCRAEIAVEWWNERMGEDAVSPNVDEGFKLNTYSTPCCTAPHTLNELVYDAPQGFARFALEAMNPKMGALTDENIAEFESILGTTLRVIRRRL